MNKKTNYFFLSGLFFVVFLVMEFTDIYEPPTWVKAFLIILCITYLISGFINRTKNNTTDDK